MTEKAWISRRFPVLIVCGLLLAILSGSFGELEGKGIWSAVAKTRQDDVWYLDQTIAYSTHDKVTASRAVLKFVPGKASVLDEQIRECLDLNGIHPDGFSYFTALVAVDCRRELLHFSRVLFFDSDDNVLWQQDYDESYHILPTEDTSTAVISGYLCLDRPGFFDTLKKKKPFLYLFP
jgi:hypothetical protein